jgi:Protein of unknown function (DUF1176)
LALLCITWGWHCNRLGKMMDRNFFSKPYSLLVFGALVAGVALVVPVFAQEDAISQQTRARVQDIYETSYDNICRGLMADTGEGAPEPEIYELSFSYDFEDTVRPYIVYEFPCFQGAYNEGFVYYGVDEYLEISHIQFARPAYDVVRKGDEFEGPVKAINISGFEVTDQIINASFDAQTGTIYSYFKWRGLGDAFSVGKWVFEQGKFILKSFDVDATYDGKRNPWRILGEGEPAAYE